MIRRRVTEVCLRKGGKPGGKARLKLRVELKSRPNGSKKKITPMQRDIVLRPTSGRCGVGGSSVGFERLNPTQGDLNEGDKSAGALRGKMSGIPPLLQRS